MIVQQLLNSCVRTLSRYHTYPNQHTYTHTHTHTHMYGCTLRTFNHYNQLLHVRVYFRQVIALSHLVEALAHWFLFFLQKLHKSILIYGHPLPVTPSPLPLPHVITNNILWRRKLVEINNKYRIDVYRNRQP